MNKKAFLLMDALINVLIVSLLSFLVMSVYRQYDNNRNTYDKYIERSNNRYEELYGGISECISCTVKEDRFQQEAY